MRFDALEDVAAESFTGRLLESGWQRVDKGDEPGVAAFSQQATEEVAYDLGLGWNAKLIGIEFWLILGVRHLEVARLVARFMGYAAGGVPTSTFGCSLIDLLPHLSPVDKADRWLIQAEADLTPVTDLALGDLERFGWPFLRSFTTLDDVVSHLENKPRYQMLSGHLAVACAVAGRRAQAEGALREWADKTPVQQGPMLQQSRNFISNFVAHFGYGAEFMP